MTQRAHDLMHRGLITCRPDATLGQVAVMLTQHRVHALYVEDNQKRILGVITDFDLLAGEWLAADEASLKAMSAMTAGEMMSTPPASIDAEAPLANPAKMMKANNYKRLLVTKGGKPEGVLSLSDLIASLIPPGINRGAVGDVMSRVFLVCRKETPVADIARGLTSARYRSTVVLDSSGRALGVVSGLDFLDAVMDSSKLKATAEQVMHPALTIGPAASLREAANQMIESYHHRLVVVDPADAQAVPLGIISTVDIVAEMAQPGSVWQKA